jgi:hypothetical protein
VLPADVFVVVLKVVVAGIEKDWTLTVSDARVVVKSTALVAIGW